MTDEDYIEATRRTDPEVGYAPDGAIVQRLGLHSAFIHYAFGLVTEAAEVADAIKKTVIYGKELDEVNLLEEIGDLQWYEARMLDALGFTFADARERNIAKLRKRFPDGFTEEDAQVRDLQVERVELEGGRARESSVALLAKTQSEAEHLAWLKANSVLADEEIREMLTSTLHGPLPQETIQRVFATLADVHRLRREAKEQIPVHSRVRAVIEEMKEMEVPGVMHDDVAKGIALARHRMESVLEVPYQPGTKDRLADIGKAVLERIASPGADFDQDILKHATADAVITHLDDLDAVLNKSPATLDAIMEIIDGTLAYGDDELELEAEERAEHVVNSFKAKIDTRDHLLNRALNMVTMVAQLKAVDPGTAMRLSNHIRSCIS